jgi:hypothetical protein
LPIIGSNTAVAASRAKNNAHLPTPEEIASRKYVVPRYWSAPLGALALWDRRIFPEVIIDRVEHERGP